MYVRAVSRQKHAKQIKKTKQALLTDLGEHNLKIRADWRNSNFQINHITDTYFVYLVIIHQEIGENGSLLRKISDIRNHLNLF